VWRGGKTVYPEAPKNSREMRKLSQEKKAERWKKTVQNGEKTSNVEREKTSPW